MKKYQGFLSLVAALIMVISWGIVAHAENMPEGLPLGPYFKTGTFVGTNSATTVDDTAGSQTQAVQLTNAANQLGTIWANKDDYYFDLTKNQKASMWMYFDDKDSKAGDGMAFVLQNDANNYAAISHTSLTNVPATGETLGVWGSPDDYTSENGASLIAKTAIQNSWALEFDTFVNNQYPQGNTANSTDYDYYASNISGANSATESPHVASAYPAVSGTYNRRYYGGQYYTLMNHSGVFKTALSDGSWHHVTLQYTAPTSYPGTGKMTYTYNDKDSTTGTAATGTGSETVNIDTQKIDPDNTGKTMWGFTGSTGQNFETSQVVFEQIPGLVDASAAAHIYDRTEDNVEVPTSGNGAVMGGDRLRLDYTLTYNSGRKAWDNIKSEIKVPTDVTVNSGTVTYADGSQETVDLSKYQAGDSELDYTLQKGLSSTGNQTATISLNATANNPATTTAVAGTTSKFRFYDIWC